MYRRTHPLTCLSEEGGLGELDGPEDWLQWTEHAPLILGLYAEHRNQQRKQTLAGRPFQSCQWTARCQEPSFPPPSSVPSAGKKTESFASFCRSPLLGEWATTITIPLCNVVLRRHAGAQAEELRGESLYSLAWIEEDEPEAEAAAEATDAYEHTDSTRTPSYAYEDSSYPDTTGVQRSHTTSYERSLPQESPQPTHPLPPIHTPAQHYRQTQGDAPAISTYSSLRSYDNTTPNQPSTPHQYNIPIPQYSRIGNVPLPSISIIQGPPQPGPSSYPPQRYTTQQQTVDHRQHRWTTQHTGRPIAPLPRTATSHAQQQAQQVPLGWSSQYSGVPYSQYRGMQQTQSDMGDWSAGTRHDDVPQQSSRFPPSHQSPYTPYATVSADRSTISTASPVAGPSRIEQHYEYTVPISTPRPQRIVQGSQGVYTPYYGGEQPAVQASSTPLYDPPPHPPPHYSPEVAVAPAPEQLPPETQVQKEQFYEQEPAETSAPPESQVELEAEPATTNDPGPSQEPSAEEERERTLTPASPSVESVGSSSRKRKKTDSDTSSDEPIRRRPKKTSIACHFCRSRKLKCDGQPICSNCSRRGIACAYAPEARRRGPGKAPKGQKKLARERTQATAGPSGVAQGSLSPPTRGRSRGRRSAQRVASSSTQSHLSQQQQPEGQPPPSFGSGDSSYDFNFEQTSTPPEPMTNPTSAEQYRRIFNLPPGFSDYQPQQSTSLRVAWPVVRARECRGQVHRHHQLRRGMCSPSQARRWATTPVARSTRQRARLRIPHHTISTSSHDGAHKDRHRTMASPAACPAPFPAVGWN
ncbi:hypothetical protein BC629DRAFT_1595632 [Irpex lacteus]|nr:hypothetical protein BC629DRAFT_1595632 [Irpex lacteus]